MLLFYRNAGHPGKSLRSFVIYRSCEEGRNVRERSIKETVSMVLSPASQVAVHLYGGGTKHGLPGVHLTGMQPSATNHPTRISEGVGFEARPSCKETSATPDPHQEMSLARQRAEKLVRTFLLS